ncbi:hypothetical protein ABPG75_009400 [Micractinium tetrahymenae]
MAEATEAPKPRKEPKRSSLHDHIMQMEPLTDRLLSWLPECFRDLAQDRRRQLLYLERRMQRKLVNEFRAQARELEPILRTRGRMVGDMLVEAVTSSDATDVTYAEVVAQSLQKTPVADRLPVREVVATLDPLLTPFITPFVEGIKAPINDKASEIQASVIKSFAYTAAGSLAVGFLLGRLLPRSGGGGGNGKR